MNVLKEIERFMSSEEEIDNKAQDAKDIAEIFRVMADLGIESINDEKMGEVLDNLLMDASRFDSLLQKYPDKFIGK